VISIHKPKQQPQCSQPVHGLPPLPLKKPPNVAVTFIFGHAAFSKLVDNISLNSFSVKGLS